MKRIFYILIFIAGFSLKSNSQGKPAFVTNEVKSVRFFPNPASSFINFEFESTSSQDYKLEIFNFLGKKVTDVKVSDKKITVSLTDFYRGVYIFQLRDPKGNIVESGKFQVVK